MMEGDPKPTDDSELWFSEALADVLDELISAGYIIDSGGRRGGQIVWVATPAGIRAASK